MQFLTEGDRIDAIRDHAYDADVVSALSTDAIKAALADSNDDVSKAVEKLGLPPLGKSPAPAPFEFTAGSGKGSFDYLYVLAIIIGYFCGCCCFGASTVAKASKGDKYTMR